MFRSKAFLITVLLLISHLSMAKPIFSPFQIFQTNLTVQAKTVSSPQKTHQARGAFPYSIPDDDPAGIDIPIDMTGAFQGDITDLQIVLDIEHSYAQDLNVTLTSPDGLAQLVLFSRIDSSADLNGEYIFHDQANNDIWTSSQSGVIPAGEYRTSTAGIIIPSVFGYANGHGGCTTRMNGAFGGLTPAQSNGVWTLHIADLAPADVGQVNNVYFTGTVNGDYLFSTGFEDVTSVPYQSLSLAASNVMGQCQKAQYDFTGTGFSDYVTSWDNFPDLNVQIITNDGTNSPSEDNTIFTGLPFSSTEMTSGGDFDGDGIKDMVFKTPYNDETFQFLIRRSSRPDDLPVSFLNNIPPAGYTLDLQLGDYDGDGLDDIALFVSRDVSTGSTLQWINSSTYTLGFFETPDGTTGDFKPGGGFDHNGDGVADFALFIDDGGTAGNQNVQVYNGTDGSLLFDSASAEFIPEAGMVPGTFLPNNLAGIAIAFGTDFDEISWFVNDDTQNYNSLTPVGGSLFGIHSTDIPVTGDYDGDGIDDFAVWRPNTDGFGSRFIIRPSGSPDPDNNLIEVSPNNAFSLDRPLANIRFR
ncbi:proprotein convertase P-domain-containing protein [Marinicella litoralis]|uniref:Proprotein convertase P-domain-containing protein n=1 Tax=Marinicella litoralis TaxID=644220 RepID=A0A4R6XLP3_9GAMM|nr:proprotein convertase P-domain-containing protein [Marinicella litoralis]TDR20552.1 proprotein convertase P-domain-containing protein [Marinicella litoralis]